jgi:hypothetical protein
VAKRRHSAESKKGRPRPATLPADRAGPSRLHDAARSASLGGVAAAIVDGLVELAVRIAGGVRSGQPGGSGRWRRGGPP